MSPNRLAWIIGGIVLGASLVLWAAPRARAQGPTPTPLGEVKREPYSEKSAPPVQRRQDPPRPSQTAPSSSQGRPAPRIVQPYCWLAYVTPDSHTVQCNNGFWQTQMADGSIVQGNGIIDPNARAPGSSIGINPATGGPSLKGDSVVTAPQGQIELEAPHQGPLWGQQPLQTR